ncbi:hypothetical protein ENUP19_0304G0043 [Entamoeba nuttalli]|uniref:Sand family protein n=2 Tax=Entamoeba nuttalli TaxID=412467 RepID=K2H6H6_ENTNP|nr:sand family protein [Entamoeba nuttalli P19]EKE38094.1 sand family protein [Entamoeba nuttalli P19]|eukprot:XP_008859565.1 sand family protein [Entamoeba nuttalli P19]
MAEENVSIRNEFSILHKRWENDTEIDMTNNAKAWEMKKKHILIYTDAGKPIFSRYGDEIKLAPFMGTLTALSSVVADLSDSTDDVVCEDGKIIIFHSVGPIEIVIVAKTGETPQQLKIEAEMIGRKLCSIVPYTTILSLFQKKTSYDFRRLILTEYDQMKFLIHSMNVSTAILYNAVSILPCTMREQINDVIINLVNTCNDKLTNDNDSIVFTLLFNELNLIYINQRSGCTLSPKDIHILMTFVQGLPTINDKWVPIGLYDFNQSGQLFVFCKFFTSKLSLVLLATKNESLPIISTCAETIENEIINVPFINQLINGPSVDIQFEESSSLYLHYIFVKIEGDNAQLHEPEFQEPYKSSYTEQKRIHRMFRTVYDEMKNQNLKEYCSKGGVDCIYATLRSDYFFCGTFNILLERDEVINRGNKIISLVRSKLDTLFITPTKKGKYKSFLW